MSVTIPTTVNTYTSVHTNSQYPSIPFTTLKNNSHINTLLNCQYMMQSFTKKSPPPHPPKKRKKKERNKDGHNYRFILFQSASKLCNVCLFFCWETKFVRQKVTLSAGFTFCSKVVTIWFLNKVLLYFFHNANWMATKTALCDQLVAQSTEISGSAEDWMPKYVG